MLKTNYQFFSRLELLVKSAIVFYLMIAFILPIRVYSQKFVGNIIGSSVPSNFLQYWNQVTPENSGKWGSVESTRDVMNWTNLRTAYNLAKNNGLPFKQHTFVWGQQEPGWIGSLSQSEQYAEVEEWIRLFGQEFPNTDYIDVVNEPLHAPASYKNALGGDGSTGWDWVITAFEMARDHCPNAQLLINDYGIISDPNAANNYVTIINLLNTRGLLDGIGIQCHAFNMDNVSVSTMNQVLNTLSATGLPIFVSELDMRGTDSEQLSRYQEKFPVFWNNSNVHGITLWGYIQGEIWQTEAWLVSSSGVERPAMQWLVNYIGGSTTTTTTASTTTTTAGGDGGPGNILVRARGETGNESFELRVNDYTVATWNVSTSYQNFAQNVSNTSANVKVYFNDSGGGNNDVQIDYIRTNNVTYQAENQATNTGVWQNSSCGGSYSEWLHCEGYIDFGTLTISGSTTTTTAATTTTTAATTTTTTGATTTTTTSGGGCTCPSLCGSSTTISLPYSQNGAGEYCWVTSNNIGYVNSWNMAEVNINGQDYTNQWANSFPAKINGNYYIYYRGNYPWSHFEASAGAAKRSIETSGTHPVPTEFALYPNFPNPFNPKTDISYQLPEDGDVLLEIFDMQGHKVKTLIHEKQNSGYYRVSWNSTDESGKRVTAGVYLYRIRIMTANKVFDKSMKMVLLK